MLFRSRFLHGSDPAPVPPFLLNPAPTQVTARCAARDPLAVAESVRRVDPRIRVSVSGERITITEIPPSALHSVLRIPGIDSEVAFESHGGLVSSAADRLSCWEFRLAADGLATKSRCCHCGQNTILPVPGSPCHALGIGFYCKSCCQFREVAADPQEYADIEALLPADRFPRVPAEASESLTRPISREDLAWYLSTLPSRKAPGPDGMPYELLKYGPPSVREAVFEAVNAILTRAARVPSSWKGGTIRYLHKGGDTTDMGNYRPVCLQVAAYKVLSAVLTDRLYRLAERHGLLSDSQEGFRRLRSTTRQAQSLQWAIEDARSRGETLFVAYLDFENAFNSSDHEGLWA